MVKSMVKSQRMNLWCIDRGAFWENLFLRSSCRAGLSSSMYLYSLKDLACFKIRNPNALPRDEWHPGSFSNRKLLSFHLFSFVSSAYLGCKPARIPPTAGSWMSWIVAKVVSGWSMGRTKKRRQTAVEKERQPVQKVEAWILPQERIKMVFRSSIDVLARRAPHFFEMDSKGERYFFFLMRLSLSIHWSRLKLISWMS